MKVGFIGLGSMGAGMSRNLIKAGNDLVVYNRTRSRSQEMQSLGAKVADTASEAAVGVDALITMMADDRAVQDVIFEPGRAIESLPERAVHISMSTISVDLSRRLAKSHAEKRQTYIAAPVFGRPDAAAAGKLFIVSAGPSESIEKCRSLFAAMGQKTFIINEDAPAANLIKLSGNFLTTTVIESLAEGLREDFLVDFWKDIGRVEALHDDWLQCLKHPLARPSYCVDVFFSDETFSLWKI